MPTKKRSTKKTKQRSTKKRSTKPRSTNKRSTKKTKQRSTTKRRGSEKKMISRSIYPVSYSSGTSYGTSSGTSYGTSSGTSYGTSSYGTSSLGTSSGTSYDTSYDTSSSTSSGTSLSFWMNERDKIISKNDYIKLREKLTDSQVYGGVSNKLLNLGPIAFNKISNVLFKKAKTWDDIVELYGMFIKGEIPGVPTYEQPLTKDVIDFLKTDNTLIKIITKYKIISVDSQPGECDNIDEGYQRSYYDFVINTDMYNIRKLLKIINNYKVFYVYLDDNSSNNIPGDFEIMYRNDILPKINDYNNIVIKDGSDQMVPLTVNSKLEWVNSISIKKKFNGNSDPILLKQYGLKFNNVTIKFMSQKFCDKSLLQIIDKIFEEYWKT